MFSCDPHMLGEGVSFERIRRLTGYLSTLEMFGNGKRSEEHDRVKHGDAQNPQGLIDNKRK